MALGAQSLARHRVASFACPQATFYAITSLFLNQPHLVFVAIVVAYGFMVIAMLIPAIDEFDVRHRTNDDWRTVNAIACGMLSVAFPLTADEHDSPALRPLVCRNGLLTLASAFFSGTESAAVLLDSPERQRLAQATRRAAPPWASCRIPTGC